MDFETRSAYAFVQHLAVRLIANGYRFYVLGQIPSWKDPEKVDSKLCSRYSLAVSKWVQLRRSRRGEAKVRYLRFGHTFVLIATKGTHHFFETERGALRDAAASPLRCFGYEIGCAISGERHRPSVRLCATQYLAFRARMLSFAMEPEEVVLRALEKEHLLWFSGVKKQVFRVLTDLNDRRRKAGFASVFVPKSSVFSPSARVFGDE
jgi:hypothetical protein